VTGRVPRALVVVQAVLVLVLREHVHRLGAAAAVVLQVEEEERRRRKGVRTRFRVKSPDPWYGAPWYGAPFKKLLEEGRAWAPLQAIPTYLSEELEQTLLPFLD
jgi:hypothetical protein